MTGVPTEAQVAAVLREHWSARWMPDGHECRCGETIGHRTDSTEAALTAHVAAVLVSTVLGPLTEERDRLQHDVDTLTHENATVGVLNYIAEKQRSESEATTYIHELQARVRLLEDGITALDAQLVNAREEHIDRTDDYNGIAADVGGLILFARSLLKGNGEEMQGDWRMTAIPDEAVHAGAKRLYEMLDSHWKDLRIPYEQLTADDPFCTEVYREETREVLYASLEALMEWAAQEIELDHVESLDLDHYDDRIYYDGKYRAAALVRALGGSDEG